MDETNLVAIMICMFTISYLGLVGIWNAVDGIRKDISPIRERLAKIEQHCFGEDGDV